MTIERSAEEQRRWDAEERQWDERLWRITGYPGDAVDQAYQQVGRLKASLEPYVSDLDRRLKQAQCAVLWPGQGDDRVDAAKKLIAAAEEMDRTLPAGGPEWEAALRHYAQVVDVYDAAFRPRG